MWVFKGLIFDKHHAQLPTPILIDDKIVMYYSTKKNNLSTIGMFEVKVSNPFQKIKEDTEALNLGEKGLFDDSGVMPSCIINKKNDLFLFYSGWNLKINIPYSHAIGISKIKKNGKLERIFSGPVLDRNIDDPYLTNSPFVEFDKLKNKWIMYYCSGTHWSNNFPCYIIKKTESDNLFYWNNKKEIFIKHSQKNQAISRICKDNNNFYYSFKTNKTNYSIFCKPFLKKPFKVNIVKNFWNSDMTCYPFILKYKNKKYMFFNGNNYGGTGIGFSEWIE